MDTTISISIPQVQKPAKSYPKKDPVIDLTKYMDKKISVKFAGGREVTGVLKGFDPLMNLVLDDVEEYVGGGTKSRNLGLVVCRSTSLILIYPVDGTEEISNPFLN